jgi:hypothetical protein
MFESLETKLKKEVSKCLEKSSKENNFDQIRRLAFAQLTLEDLAFCMPNSTTKMKDSICSSKNI